MIMMMQLAIAMMMVLKIMIEEALLRYQQVGHFQLSVSDNYEDDLQIMIILQPVSVIDQRGNPKQVEVDVNLCYCSTQNCNQVIFKYLKTHNLNTKLKTQI